MRIDILDAARADLDGSAAFYERQQQGLGRRFLEEIFSDIDALRRYAGVHHVHFGFHRMLAKRFPYAIYYRLENDRVRIYAVLDCRRAPSWIENRLKKPE